MSELQEPADDALASTTESGAIDVEAFAADGQSVDMVPVHISYGIIERFSEGLYSSPVKTFEELVTNSYDAGAERVWVYLPADFQASDAALVVIDDGESMDLEGLKNLWRIGESQKRGDQRPAGRKRPVGKFGIGKLATYVLAQRLTYIVHHGGRHLAVTMDYAKVAQGDEFMSTTNLALQVVELTAESAKKAVREAMKSIAPDETQAEQELAKLGEGHWTAAILTNLKQTAQRISIPRLRWVLSTALPLNPGFALWLNDDRVHSSKEALEPSWTFVVGRDEEQLADNPERPWKPGSATVVEAEVEQSPVEGEKEATLKTVEIPALKLEKAGVVSGTAYMYDLPLERGKSEGLGRSHGYFVRVRGRLINLDSEDFEVGPELRHGTLTRFRMEINADDLDDEVASARESLKESEALTQLKNYMLAVFNRARAVTKLQDEDDSITRLSKAGRLSDPPAGLSQGPLRRMLQRAATGDRNVQDMLGFTEEQAELANSALSDDKELVESVLLETVEADRPFVVYDPGRRAAVLNQNHPFVANYAHAKGSAEPIKLLGLTEILGQAYLLDENVPADAVSRVVRRRDSFLRALANRYPRSAPVIAQQLRDATNNENALEDAVGDALELLGFEVQRFGGAGHGVDGIATARLGWRNEVKSISYALTYDAKSTANAKKKLTETEDGGPPIEFEGPGKIRADTARTSILKVHRQRALEAHDLQVEPKYTLLVAPDYQGASDELGLINAVCENDGITAIRVGDLATLVELFALQGFTPADLAGLFDLRTPEDTKAWVAERAKLSRIPSPPVGKLVDILVRRSEAKLPATRDAVAAWLDAEGHELSIPEVDALCRGLGTLAPRSVYVDDRMIALNASPAALYAEIRQTLDEFDANLAEDYLNTVPDGNAT